MMEEEKKNIEVMDGGLVINIINVIGQRGNDKRVREIDIVISEYMQCKQAVYQFRLKVLWFIREYISQQKENSKSSKQRLYLEKVGNLMEYHYYFQKQYDGEYKEWNNQIQQKYMKEISEYEKLVGWQSNNHLVVKMTTDKFHRKLNRVIRLYRGDISESIQVVREGYSNKYIKGDVEGVY